MMAEALLPQTCNHKDLQISYAPNGYVEIMCPDCGILLGMQEDAYQKLLNHPVIKGISKELSDAQ